METTAETTPHFSEPSNKRNAATTAPSLEPATRAMDLGFDALLRSIRLRTLWPRMQRLCPPRSERLWVIGGRPGNYKTQLAWNLAVDMALCKQRVLFVSLEQTTGEMAIQAVARFARTPLDVLERAQRDEVRLTTEQDLGLVAASQRLGETEMYLRLHGADQHGRSIGEVVASATRARFDAIFVDHLGMIGRDGGNKFEVLEKAIDQLRALTRGQVAKDYRPFVCALSPLNRDGEKEGDEKPRLPRMSDFSGSSRIESDADLAMVVRKRHNESEDAPDIVDAFVLKNRQGRCPVVLTFEAQGAICTVTERHTQQDGPPPHWQERGE